MKSGPKTEGQRADLPVPDHTPRVPSVLSDEARGVWRRIVKTLRDCGLYASVDRDALAMYCQAVGWWRRAQVMIQKSGPVLVSDKGNLYHNPWWSVASKSFDQATKLSKSFGLSPEAREKIDLRKVQNETAVTLQNEIREILEGVSVSDEKT